MHREWEGKKEFEPLHDTPCQLHHHHDAKFRENNFRITTTYRKCVQKESWEENLKHRRREKSCRLCWLGFAWEFSPFFHPHVWMTSCRSNPQFIADAVFLFDGIKHELIFTGKIKGGNQKERNVCTAAGGGLKNSDWNTREGLKRKVSFRENHTLRHQMREQKELPFCSLILLLLFLSLSPYSCLCNSLLPCFSPSLIFHSFDCDLISPAVFPHLFTHISWSVFLFVLFVKYLQNTFKSFIPYL